MTSADKDNNHNLNMMILSGDGQVVTVPDIAIVRLGVESTGTNLTALQEENAAATQSVIDAIKNLGVTDIKTYQYSIEKAYNYENGRRIDLGYTIRNIIEFRTDAIDQIGRIIDSAVSSGANVVDLVSFDISDADAYYQQALNLAVLNAYDKARSISTAFGLPLNPIPHRITEKTTTPIPFTMLGTAREIASTPIESGNKMINASVTAEFVY